MSAPRLADLRSKWLNYFTKRVKHVDVYSAIMKAADYIERNPDDFKFSAIEVPGHCGSRGCALGWIGYFAGASGFYNQVSEKVLGLQPSMSTGGMNILGTEFTFYDRLSRLNGGSHTWMNDAGLCAKALRLYASKYHAPAKSVVLRSDAELVKHWISVVRQQRFDETKPSEELVW